jgi:hypothetical protein
MKCPNCKRPLEETFVQRLLPNLVSAAIWACLWCPYGKNRFDAKGRPIPPEETP